ncbi:36458_t:CDS:2 [Racocetra persica]|uniref:36458_t:CDS:1 n=1 Tax=Racocetra persica TaxID=160502 RepID=A0ACA9KLK5_9GLOM|nr:36458_t:CDS:2 [Racocetra persica]
MSQQRSKAKSIPILEKPPNALSDSSKISQDLFNFGNQSSTSTYLSPNYQETRVEVNSCPNQNRPFQSWQTSNSSIKYYNYRKRGQIARNCLAEQCQNTGRPLMNSNGNMSQPRNVNLCDIYTRETEDELYAIKHRERPKNEPNWDERLRKRVISEPNQMTQQPT